MLHFKTILLTSCLLLIAAFKGLGQQNLVPNPSFEDTAYCVTSPGDMPAALGWVSYADSPDYFNPCTSNNDVSVPNNWGGYQQPASGNAYSALGTYCTDCGGLPNTREFIGRALSASLSVGTKYYVSFEVCLSISSTIWANCATNNIGAAFFTIPYNWSTHPLSVNNNPKIYCDSIIADTINWTRVFGSFVADSAYKYIAIGNLFDDSHTDTLIVDSAASPYSNCSAYYYVDDVCVSTDSSYAANYFYTGIQKEHLTRAFKIYPNPASSKLFINNRLFNNKYNLIIYNDLGQKILEEQHITNVIKQIDLSGFANGLYIVNISTRNQSINYKFLKL